MKAVLCRRVSWSNMEWVFAIHMSPTAGTRPFSLRANPSVVRHNEDSAQQVTGNKADGRAQFALLSSGTGLEKFPAVEGETVCPRKGPEGAV